jgi:hypothetical protein
MIILSKDIEDKIEELFTSSSDRQEVKKLLLMLWTTSLNVGPDQLARSILIISDGKLDNIKKVLESVFQRDPIDIIMKAEERMGNPGHFFIEHFLDNQNSAPPNFIDGARVIKWAWSGEKPFGFVGEKNNKEREIIYGLAICQYDEDDRIYRFSCNSNWETVQDDSYNNIENAIDRLPDQYKMVKANWQTK